MAEIYTVQAGDSLSIIARDILGDIEQWPAIAHLNQLDPPYLIYPGQVLQLPNDSEPLTIVIDRWPDNSPSGDGTAAPVKKANVMLTPATLLLLGVAVAVLLRK